MRLLVILASPPLTTSGRRTLAQVEALASLMLSDSVAVGNLCTAPAADLPGLATAGAETDPWLASRGALAAALEDCDEVVAAWGLYALTGPAKTHRSDQLAWLVKTSQNCWVTPTAGPSVASPGTRHVGTSTSVTCTGELTAARSRRGCGRCSREFR